MHGGQIIISERHSPSPSLPSIITTEEIIVHRRNNRPPKRKNNTDDKMPIPTSSYERQRSMRSNYSYHGSPGSPGRYYSNNNSPNNSPNITYSKSFNHDDGISVDELPADGYPSGCTACATAAWLDTLRFIQYMCM